MDEVKKKASPYGSIKFTSIDEYISSYPLSTQVLLQELRQIIQRTVPDTMELISYNMPAFKRGKVLVYFAAHKHHIGFYPTSSPIVAFQEALVGFTTSKGAIQFPLDQPLPVALIQKMVLYRAAEVQKNG